MNSSPKHKHDFSTTNAYVAVIGVKDALLEEQLGERVGGLDALGAQVDQNDIEQALNEIIDTLTDAGHARVAACIGI